MFCAIGCSSRPAFSGWSPCRSLAHGALIAGLLFAPRGLLTHRPEAPRSVMTISLGGSGTSGPQNGGLTSIGGRPVQVQTPPDETAEARGGAAARGQGAGDDDAGRLCQADEDEGRDPARSSRRPTRRADARRRSGAEVREGSAVAETGARGKGFGLSTGGAPGSGATLDVADFCCPDYHRPDDRAHPQHLGSTRRFDRRRHRAVHDRARRDDHASRRSRKAAATRRSTSRRSAPWSSPSSCRRCRRSFPIPR